MAIDRSGTPYVAYLDSSLNYKANVMKFNGSAWVSVGGPRFSSDSSARPNIAIDSHGTPYVAYSNLGYSGTSVMKYDGSRWVYVGIPNFSKWGSSFTDIALDENDTPYVTYQDFYYTDKATVMKYNGSSWINVGSPGFTPGGTGEPCIAIDHSGTPYVGYQDVSDSQKASVMKYDGNHWVSVGGVGFSAGQAWNLSIAINASGTPYLDYVDWGNHYRATVMELGPYPITGAFTVCIGSTAALSDTSGGGEWSASNTTIATIGSGTGIVTGISVGTTTISYTVSGLSVTANVAVDSLPSAGIVTGSSGICIGLNTTLSDSIAGGKWSSSNTAIASISSTGIVVGVGAGIGTISYSVTNSCGTSASILSDTVTACPALEIKNISISETLTIAPNPARGSLTLNLSSVTNESAQIIITNIVGGKVKEFTITTNKETQTQLDAPPGMYFLTAVTKHDTQTAKFIIQ